MMRRRVPILIAGVSVWSLLHTTLYQSGHLPRSIHELNEGNGDAWFLTDPPDGNLPWIIIHPGPPKTATSTIQHELGTLSEVLALDNYLYLGKFLQGDNKVRRFSDPQRQQALELGEALVNKRCSLALHKARMAHNGSQNDSKASLGSLREALLKVPCAARLTEYLQPLAQNKTSLIVSEEALVLPQFMNSWQDMPRGPLDYIALQELVRPFYRIRVAATYRRLFDWLPSCKQQHDKWNPNKSKLNKWPQEGGRRMQDTWSFIEATDWTDASHWGISAYTHAILGGAARSGGVDTVVVNMHDRAPRQLTGDNSPAVVPSVRTLFVCDALVGAHLACQECLRRDAMEVERKENTHGSFFYDRLTTDAADIGLFDYQRFNRHKLAEQVRRHQEETLRRTFHDFPLRCPSSEQLEGLRNRTQVVEQALLPDFFNSLQGREQLHLEFNRAVEKKKFCTIDSDTTLNTSEWKSFFAGLAQH